MSVFVPLGNTVSFTAAITAPAAVQAVSVPNKRTSFYYRIINTGNELVFFGRWRD